MTFDFTPEQQALVTRAREAAAAIGEGVANVIDTLGSVPEDVSKSLKAQSLKHVFEHGVMNAVLVIEELAAVSAGLAAHIGFDAATGSPERKTVIPQAFPGLRSAETQLAAVEIGSDETRARGRLAAAAVALGIGRAAVTHAVASMKKNEVKPGPDTEAPHWTLADGATEVEAARVLAYSAAQSVDRGQQSDDLITRALDYAANAAQQAVDAAIRVEGSSGYLKGSLLERLSRDARTLQVILR
jgi:alkylation response protein AidB-like acyl-CoA dehydrogenase